MSADDLSKSWERLSTALEVATRSQERAAERAQPDWPERLSWPRWSPPLAATLLSGAWHPSFESFDWRKRRSDWLPDLFSDGDKQDAPQWETPPGWNASRFDTARKWLAWIEVSIRAGALQADNDGVDPGLLLQYAKEKGRALPAACEAWLIPSERPAPAVEQPVPMHLTADEQCVLRFFVDTRARRCSVTRVESRCGLTHKRALDALHGLDSWKPPLLVHEGKHGGWSLTTEGEAVGRRLPPPDPTEPPDPTDPA